MCPVSSAQFIVAIVAADADADAVATDYMADYILYELVLPLRAVESVRWFPHDYTRTMLNCVWDHIVFTLYYFTRKQLHEPLLQTSIESTR